MKILTEIYEKIYSLISQIFINLFGLIEFLLFLRLILKFLGANPKSLVVNYLYKYSDILISPFNSIFPDIYWPKGYLIETTAISAMIGYAIAFFLLFFISRLFPRD